VSIHEADGVPARETEDVECDTLAAANRSRGEQLSAQRERTIMGYYENEATETESSFADPSAELEVQAEGDEPSEDLGDGLRRRKQIAELEGGWNFERSRAGRAW
jgi:hypothetical protein